MVIILLATMIVDHGCMTVSMLVIDVTVITVDIKLLYWFGNVLIMSNDNWWLISQVVRIVADKPQL